MMQTNPNAALRQQAEVGSSTAQVELAKSLIDSGEGAAIEIISWLRKAAASNHAEAFYLLGKWYQGAFNTKGMHQIADVNQATYWFKKAASRQYPLAAVALGKLFISYQQFDKALHWLFQAAQSDNCEAMTLLGDYFFEPGYGCQDFARAMTWYLTAAEHGSAEGQYKLGICYRYGHGVDQHYGLAINWLRLAAKQKHADACCALADMYFYGIGTAKQYLKAMTWYNFAARCDQPKALYQIGLIYQQGLGIAANQQRGDRYIQEAAALGYQPLF